MKKIFFVASILIFFVGLFLYQTFNSESINTSIIVKNGTQYSVEAIGIYGDNKLIFNKTEGKVFEFPKQIVGDMKSISIVAIDKNGKSFLSGRIDLEGNREVTITEINEDGISLNVISRNKDKLLDIPVLDEWKVSTEGKYISGKYQAKTNWNYTIYVLGKGGKLGMSDTRTNNDLVTASWEKPNKPGSWIVFEIK